MQGTWTILRRRPPRRTDVPAEVTDAPSAHSMKSLAVFIPGAFGYNTAMDPGQCITPIGTPAAGKSTVGVLPAKQLARPFVDVDIFVST